MIPKFCITNILFLLGIMMIDGGEKIGNGKVDAESRKAMQLFEFIKWYRELALTAQDASEFLGRRAEISW